MITLTQTRAGRLNCVFRRADTKATSFIQDVKGKYTVLFLLSPATAPWKRQRDFGQAAISSIPWNRHGNRRKVCVAADNSVPDNFYLATEYGAQFLRKTVLYAALYGG